MTPDDALKIADQVLLASTGQHLTDVQRLILQESLAGKKYEAMEGYSSQHIKNEGKALWNLLSGALGEKVSKTNFRGALEKRWKLGSSTPEPPVLSIYSPQTWVGRTAIIDKLLPKLQGQTRLLWISGISGIGKTTLGECLASHAWNSDSSFQWVYLEILEGQSPEFVSVAADLLEKLGDRDLDPQERNDSNRLMKRLLRKLQANHYWIQIDSLERLFNAESSTETEFTDNHWITFFQQCLGDQAIASRLVLTAQALPTALLELSDRHPNACQTTALQGLAVDEQHDEHLELFAKYGVRVNPSGVAHLKRIGQIYEGHPLVLQVIAKEIMLSPFDGNVANYWQRYGNEFEQVARELQTEQMNSALYNQALQKQVRRRVEKSLKQLSSDAFDLLCRSSVYRRPVPETFWLAMIGDRTPAQQQAAYAVLSDRALVEQESVHQGQFLIRQHNLIRSVAYDLLKANTKTWEVAGRQAANLWVTAYKPASNVSNLEKVRGYLEAFWHYCQISHWFEAEQILEISKISSENIPLHVQLSGWGYFQEVKNLYLSVIGKSNFLSREANWNSGLGLVYFYLGFYRKASKHHQLVTKIGRGIRDSATESKGIGNWGMAEEAIGNYEQAISLYETQLNIARDAGDWEQEISALGNLGNVFYQLENYDQAMSFYQKSYAAAEKHKCLSGKNKTLSNIANVQMARGQYRDAAKKIQSALDFFILQQDKLNQSKVLLNLAELKLAVAEVQASRQYCQQALSLATELGIPLKTECEALLAKLDDCPSEAKPS